MGILSRFRRKRQQKVALKRQFLADKTLGKKAMIRMAQNEGLLPIANPVEIPKITIVKKGCLFRSSGTVRTELLALRRMERKDLRSYLLALK